MTDSKRPEPPSKDSPPGRVRHDASGRAVWEWAVDTGRQAMDSTSRLLKRLELPGLSLEEDSRKKQKEASPAESETPAFGGPREHDPKAGSRQSFNPYDNRSPARRTTTSGKPTAKADASAAAPVTPRKPGYFARLFGRH